jgi:hypothetical protein
VSDSTVQADRTLRVSLVGCSGVLGDIIRKTLGEQPDMAVVEDLESIPADGALSVSADLLVWNNADESRVERWLRTAAEPCGPRVLATLGDGRDAVLWELTPHRTPLGAPSPAALVQTIRTSFASSGGGSLR